MPDPAETPEAGRDQPPAREPYIPKPPSREDLEEISREQAMITDDWTGEGPEQAPRPSEPG